MSLFNSFYLFNCFPPPELTVSHTSVLTILAITVERYYAVCFLIIIIMIIVIYVILIIIIYIII